MKKTKWNFSLFSASILAIFLFSGCQPKENVLNLGLISPLTGNGAINGLVQESAAKMAVDEINAAGGIDGKIKIKLISEDDEGSPSKSVMVTRRLVSQNKVQVIIGALNSTCTLADMQITSKAKIPQIAPSSTAATITQQGNKYIFRNAASDVTHVNTLFKYAAEQLKAKKVAILYESTDFGAGGQKLLSAKAKELGVTVTTSEVYNSGEKDFSVQLTKIKHTNPDVIFLYGYYAEVALISKQAIQYSIKTPLMGTGFNSPKLIQLGGDAVNGLMFSTTFTEASTDPKVQIFIEKYKKLYKQNPDQNAAQVYDAVYIVEQAVKTAGLDSEKIRDAISNMKDYPGVSGVTRFDLNGEVIKNIEMVRIENGKHVVAK